MMDLMAEIESEQKPEDRITVPEAEAQAEDDYSLQNKLELEYDRSTGFYSINLKFGE